MATDPKYSGRTRLWAGAVLLPFLCLAELTVPAMAQQAADAVAPEEAAQMGASDAAGGAPAHAASFMVAAANPLAAEAGRAVLERGGNAIDAMVAVQLVLGLVEPQSSGIGGGAFLVYFDAENERLTTYDGRETAPMAATPRLFQDEDGEPLGFFDAVVGGRSVGTPGTVRLLHDTHTRHGSLDWAELVQPAVDLAESGFEVSPRLSALIGEDAERLRTYAGPRDYFFTEDGAPLPAGHRLINQAYADTLTAIAEGGADAFYEGPIAKAIVETVRNAEGNPGVLAVEDLATYRIKERAPVCILYRGHDVCGMGPPSSGALTVGQILGIVENFDLGALGPDNAESWRLIGDASRLAFADRGRYMADIDYVPMPLEGLLDKDYLAERAALLDGDQALPGETVKPGTPTWDHAMLLADDISLELPSTSHFSIVDAEGNVVSMTTTIENGFGSRLMVNGFLLNNELTDFSFASHADGVPIANRVEPGKRPRSSMSPTIVMRDGVPVIATGSPGGSRIIGYVAQTLIALIDWQMNAQAAADMPRLVNRFGTFDLEAGTTAEALAEPLAVMGYETDIRDLTSGVHTIVIGADGLEGGADPRREGVALGG